MVALLQSERLLGVQFRNRQRGKFLRRLNDVRFKPKFLVGWRVVQTADLSHPPFPLSWPGATASAGTFRGVL